MFNKKFFAIVLSAALLSGAISIGAYKIFTKNTPSTVTTDPNVNFQSIVDSIDYTENLLDSNQVYKQKFDKDLSSQGKWIPVKQKDFIRELTNPTQTQSEAPEIQNVANQNNEPVATNNNTTLANNRAPENDDETFTEEVSSTNLTSANNESVRNVTETKTIEKIIYIWQPNECSDRNWNPYSNGHWEFTCAGWVWASDYSWGSHCYNYGRWMWTSYAGWVWMPGGRWAPNWVTWRYCGNYYGGSYCSWYPTCPVVYWQNPHHLVVCNSHFTSNPIHWTVVNTHDLTKHIPPMTKIDPKKNIEIINNSEKIKNVHTLVDNNINIRYNGPNVIDISKATNTKITPKIIDIPTKSEGTSSGTNTNTSITKNPNGPKNPVKVNPVKNNNEINPVKLIDDITKQNVSNPGNVNITKDPQIKQPPVKQPPVKTTTITKNAGPSVNPPPVKGNTKTDPPAKNLPPVKTPKTETPKQDPPPVKNNPPVFNPPPVKNDPPKYDPPPVRNDPPPVKQDPPPVRQDPPPVKQDPPPVKQDPPPVKQDPPPVKQDPPKKDDKKGD